MGTETEFGISVLGHPHANPMMASTRLVNAYEHHPELAPTTELRQLQYAEDDRQGVGKRSRAELAPAYVERYTREILDRADLGDVAAALPAAGAGALFCVERDPEACHRSLVAERLAAEHGVEVSHLR